jgi:5-methylcytosine-specific restriction protein B
MIKKAELDFFLEYAGKPYDKNNNQHQEARKRILNGIFSQKNLAMEIAAKKLFPALDNNDLDISGLDNVHSASKKNIFRNMLYQKFSPKNKFSRLVDYWFNLTGNKFVISLGIKHDISSKNLKLKSEKLNSEFNIEDSMEFTKDITEEELADWIVKSVNKFDLTYNEYCKKLQPELDEDFEKNQIKNSKDMNDQKKKTKDMNEQKEKSKDINYPRNQILYGPPGTGKTFNTINQALSIADPNFQKDSKSRKEIKERFDQLIEEGQIVFTTFHQSMSYEDFIEGIKPVITESEGSLTYEIQPGIFKALCDSAQTRNSHGFDIAYKKLQERLAQLNENEKLPLTTATGKEFSISLNSKGNFYLYTGQDQNRQGVLTKDNLRKQINGEDIWYQGYNTGVLNLLEREYGYSPNQLETAKDYVLIIDEINRGNVSQIFGELITLIEDDKRLGRSEGISITLPYSKQKFGVPSNVYIIGTMNTADRSVEALDAALRRRFSFIEMPPKPGLIKTEGKLKDKAGILDVGDLGSIDLANLLEVINKRIEKLLDSDHQIGHSFFLPVSSISSLKEVFQNKIIPLLKEYFYGDFGKLGLVLGKGFFEPTETSSSSIFADFGDFDSNDFSERVIYKLKNISSDELSGMNDNDFFEAISKLLNS